MRSTHLRPAAIAAAALFALVALPRAACAGAIAVSVNGADSPTCGGSLATACATIAQAVANAPDGATILVWPGTYAGATITKPVTLMPRSGGGGAILTGSTQLAANGIVFGKRGKGFSVQTGGVTVSADDVVVRGNYFSNGATCLTVASGSAVVVRDNTFAGCTIGVQDSGTGTQVRGNRFAYMSSAAISLEAASSACIVRENRMLGPSGSGVSIQGANHLLWRNLAHSTAAGGFVATSGAATDVTIAENLVIGTSAPSYLLTVGSGWILERNAALGCAAPGFYLMSGTTALLTDNVAMGGAGSGFQITGGSDHVLDGNSAIDNGAEGIFLSITGTGVVVRGGNLYGNGAGNCGLTNSSASLVKTSGVYWGDAAGPGADPADAVCGNIAAVDVASPAPSPTKVKMPAIK